MIFSATKARVFNRGVPTDDFLTTLVTCFRALPDEIFAERRDPAPPDIDIYTKVRPALGPWLSLAQRRAGLAEALRVLGMFESSDRWCEGADATNPTEDNPETKSAGVFQISYNSRAFGQDLRDMLAARGIHDGDTFQARMKCDHPFAIEYAARLLRHTDRHNGPVHRHEIDPWLSRAAVAEFQGLLAGPSGLRPEGI